jgi:ribonuclease P protein component
MTAGDPESPTLGRITRPADYARVLATPLRLRSAHFAVHHLDERPLPPKRLLPRDAAPAGEAAAPVSLSANASGESAAPVNASLSTELSTIPESGEARGVDDFRAATNHGTGPQRWLGLVVPKRHARRAVTRTLVKRQIRNAAADCAERLAQGLWVVRQRAPFDLKQFPSAASDALKEAARTELRALFERAARGERDALKPRPSGPKPAPRPETPRGDACAS